MGRPTKLTPDRHEAIVKSLLIGATRKDAAEAAGVDYTTFLKWMQRGEKAKSGAFFKFYNAASEAEAKARINYTTVIARAANGGDWRAALEYLKRRDRPNWGDGVDITTNGESINAIEETRERILATVARRSAQDDGE